MFTSHGSKFDLEYTFASKYSLNIWAVSLMGDGCNQKPPIGA